ncbi:toll/interleukin-1 receptor domain-containing protein [Paenibacillus naphthalenovorans]|uniref:toll/interleukin-1 receptor domain-containing protein n=1 Tax=Paenibacillus naphthalenovorans TaxID=162209 RepID=UPI0010B87CCF|nr:toll/interleukin-1 receptor domain-containing protein [Paenibacillus naphthalenovorans]GCL74915.1 toll/interleukin-1 receptor domain-containing protein [Paenibacillus naphthalenovorans]
MYDLFISHASEDKDNFVRPLALLLQRLSVSVWYDEFSLSLGDSLSGSIDKGLIDSKFGLVVLSKDFMIKKWPDYELRSLLSKELAYGKVILPIWHGINREDLLNFSPYLLDKFAVNTNQRTIEEIALNICKIVNPDIFNNLTRSMVYEQMYSDPTSGDEKSFNKQEIQKIIDNFPVRHKTLPLHLVNRIKIIYHLFSYFSNQTLEKTIDNFKHDTQPEREIVIWEAICSTYIEILKLIPNKEKTKKEAFGLVLFISTNQNRELLYKRFRIFNQDIIETAINKFKDNLPVENSSFLAMKK